MHYVDIPTARELGELDLERADACVSIYLPTTPVSRETEASRIALGNLVKKAVAQLEAESFDKRRIWPLQEQFDSLLADNDFWSHQANSLAILATPDSMRTYRLANKLVENVEVSDRFHIKPLLRAITFPQAAHVLAISENSARLIEISPDLPAAEIEVPNLPENAAAVGSRGSAKNYTGAGHRHGTHGEDFHLGRYVRKVSAALRPLMRESGLPVVLAAAQPMEALFRGLSDVEFLAKTIAGNPDHLAPQELEKAARPILDDHYDERIQEFHRLFEQRSGQQRTTTDITDAARLATFGGIDTVLVDIDSVVDGLIDEETGEVTFDSAGDAINYGIVDEIAGRALRTGATVLAVRRADIPGRGDLAAISRYPI
ncbi:MAG TPA: hypothetical protein VK064_00565 [Wenzhouxiangella sp.]|nr:hypothetical protein [Wenzhouxiangella sp.]